MVIVSGVECAIGSHPVIVVGSYRWFEAVVALRSALVGGKWEQEGVRNVPCIISPDERVFLMVAAGSQNTGIHQMPKSAILKGIMT